MKFISIKGAREHNLKNINVNIPKNTLTVITGVSGSGKSTLAFDTIYAEGQRRYVESLSVYARQFLDSFDKPDVDSIEGLSPAISIEQKTTSNNPRSTVGTITEIYDYLRLLYARGGTAYSPATGKPIDKQTITQMVDTIIAQPEGTKINILAPIVRGKKGEYKKEIEELEKKGFARIKIDGVVYNIDETPELSKTHKHDISIVVDRIVIKNEQKSELSSRLAASLETTLALANGIAVAELIEQKQEITFSEKFACPVSGFVIEEIEPRLFSFNNPFGACGTCNGLGIESDFDINLIIPDKTKSILEAIVPFNGNTPNTITKSYLESFCKHYGINPLLPFNKLPEDIQHKLMYGTKDEAISINFETKNFSHKAKKPFEGVIKMLERRLKETTSESAREYYHKFQAMQTCSICNGARLNQKALQVKIDHLNISEVTNKSIKECLAWATNLPNSLNSEKLQIAERVIKEIVERLNFLNNVGIGYLTLNRSAGTLSGGEAQRIRLASQIGSGLTGVLYVLDEPSIGLHQKDNDRLIDTLLTLKNLDNTVLVVEHDEDTINTADYLIDMGPMAGEHGGDVIAAGTVEEVKQNKNSLTGKYLTGELKIPVPEKLRKGNGKKLTIKGASGNNLKNLSASFPLGTFIGVSGVSGGGKSTLINETLYKATTKILNGSGETPLPYSSITGLEYIDKVIDIDQSPIGRMPTSNPATYTKVFDLIRAIFAELPEAKARGYNQGRFSFNVKGGRCEKCTGDGVIKIEMHFLPDVYITCEECKGKRYNKETLEVLWKNKSIADVLDMTVEEGVNFFSSISTIHTKLKALFDVGLGYMKLGQSATTLSGGEAQRVKLARELSKKSTGKTLYILDEPTTGLHFHDIKQLLEVLHALVDKGNTVIVIEHNLDVLKTSDYIIDIGPEGGIEGGEIVASGTPNEVANNKNSYTGIYLKKVLNR
ncbi:excinuclease ABC subunit UvrA [Rickettsiales bacterium LUAb2]